MMQGFDVHNVESLRTSLEERFEVLNKHLQKLPPLLANDVALVSASNAAADDYSRLLSAFGRRLSDAERDEVAMDLRTHGVGMQQRILGAVKKAEPLEVRREKNADGWPSVPLPQGCWLAVFVVYRVLRFFLFTLFIDVPSMLGFPVFLGWLRFSLVCGYSFMTISFVLHWFSMPHEDGPSSPAAAPAAALAPSALAIARWVWQGTGYRSTACVAAVALLFEKDLAARASAVLELRDVAKNAAKVPDKLPHPELRSLREALQD